MYNWYSYNNISLSNIEQTRSHFSRRQTAHFTASPEGGGFLVWWGPTCPWGGNCWGDADPVSGHIDTHDRKYYLAGTSLVTGNKYNLFRCVIFYLVRNLHHYVKKCIIFT